MADGNESNRGAPGPGALPVTLPAHHNGSFWCDSPQ